MAVDILNGYECLLEFASDCDIAQIAQYLEKVICWHEVPVSIMHTTSSEKNHVECISRERQEYHRGRKEVEQEFCERQDAQKAMMQKMINDFEGQITRLGAVQAAQSHLTTVSIPGVEGHNMVTPTGSWNWPEVSPPPPAQKKSMKPPKLSQFSRVDQPAMEESNFEQWMFEVKAV